MESKALTVPETQQLASLEATIERGVKTFVDVGNALVAIRDGRLYRAEYGTFREYCKQRWGFTDRRARLLMSASEVVANVQSGSIDPLPATESQARPLSKLPADKQPEAWQAATGRAEGEGRRVTARDVEEAVVEVMPDEAGESRPRVVHTETYPVSHAKQFASMAIRQLERIQDDDPCALEQLNRVIDWINERISRL